MHHITAIYDSISWWVAKKKVLNYHVISRSTNKNNLKLTPCVHKENLENETKVTLGLINLNIFSASVGVFSKVEMKTELETNQPAFNSETLCRSLKGNERRGGAGEGCRAGAKYYNKHNSDCSQCSPQANSKLGNGRTENCRICLIKRPPH